MNATPFLSLVFSMMVVFWVMTKFVLIAREDKRWGKMKTELSTSISTAIAEKNDDIKATIMKGNQDVVKELAGISGQLSQLIAEIREGKGQVK